MRGLPFSPSTAHRAWRPRVQMTHSSLLSTFKTTQLVRELSVYCRPSIRSDTVCTATVCAIFLAANRRLSSMSRRVASMFLWHRSPFCSHCLGPLS